MKKLSSIIMILCLMVLLACPALAESYTTDTWTVKFTADEKMVQDFGKDNKDRTINSLGTALDDANSDLQPGDDILYTLKLTNEHAETTDWYMTNTVLDSLEETTEHGATHGGAYTYTLIYTGPDGVQETLFNSDTVGGDAIVLDREGLKEATGSLEDFFYLDTLASGQSGTITLHVLLDGETQGNDYQDTLADLQMNFAVELDRTSPTPTPGPSSSPTPTPKPGSGTPSSSTTVVKTGDEMNVMPFYIGMAVSGVLFLVLAIDSLRRRKKEADTK